MCDRSQLRGEAEKRQKRTDMRIDLRETGEALRHIVTGIVLASGIVMLLVIAAIATGVLTIR